MSKNPGSLSGKKRTFNSLNEEQENEQKYDDIDEMSPTKENHAPKRRKLSNNAAETSTTATDDDLTTNNNNNKALSFPFSPLSFFPFARAVFQNILSLSDEEDEDDDIDTFTWLTTTQQTQLNKDGYCVIEDDATKTQEIVYLIHGYVRKSYDGKGIIIKELIAQITHYYGSKYDNKLYIELISGDQIPRHFLVPKINLKLSKLIGGNIGNTSSPIEVKQVKSEILHHVLTYLGHHKGIEPDPLSRPIRSIHMSQIVADQWDATFIDVFTKKTIFDIILAANYMDIKCLIHLGCAKVATLVKRLDETEINRMMDEEQIYRF